MRSRDNQPVSGQLSQTQDESVSYWLGMTVSLKPPGQLWLREATSPLLLQAPLSPRYTNTLDCSTVLYSAGKQEARWEMDAVGKK